jgi:hypothetical protein
MLPAWSRKLMPLVFIILLYGLLKVLLPKPVVWGHGADMSLRTICTDVSQHASTSISGRTTYIYKSPFGLDSLFAVGVN